MLVPSAIALLLGLLVVLLLVAAARLAGRIEALETPRIEIIYDGGPTCRQVEYGSDAEGNPQWIWTQYRVGIRNSGAVTIDEVTVLLRSLDPAGPPNVPIPLVMMNDQANNYRTNIEGFRLHPSPLPSRYIDIVIQHNTGLCRFEWPNGGGWNLGFGEYSLVVEAHGRGVPAASKTFYLTNVEGQPLDFQPPTTPTA